MDLLIIYCILFISWATSTLKAITTNFSNFLQIYFCIDFSGQLIKPAGFPVSPGAQLSLVLGAADLVRFSLLIPCVGLVTILRESPSVWFIFLLICWAPNLIKAGVVWIEEKIDLCVMQATFSMFQNFIFLFSHSSVPCLAPVQFLISDNPFFSCPGSYFSSYFWTVEYFCPNSLPCFFLLCTHLCWITSYFKAFF